MFEYKEKLIVFSYFLVFIKIEVSRYLDYYCSLLEEYGKNVRSCVLTWKDQSPPL